VAETGWCTVVHGRARRRCSRAAAGTLGLSVVVGLLAVIALAATAGAAPLVPDGKAVTVKIGATGITPLTATAKPGDTVVWVNDARSVRSVVASDASFDSGPLDPGEQFQFAFTQPRTITYTVPEVSGTSGMVVVGKGSSTAGAEAVPSSPPATAAPLATPAPQPAGFAYTGAGTAVEALIGGTVIALGAGLLISARRFGLAGAIAGLRFALVPDDLLPTRRHRRVLRERSRRSRRLRDDDR
jgi:plastocyanin